MQTDQADPGASWEHPGEAHAMPGGQQELHFHGQWPAGEPGDIREAYDHERQGETGQRAATVTEQIGATAEKAREWSLSGEELYAFANDLPAHSRDPHQPQSSAQFGEHDYINAAACREATYGEADEARQGEDELEVGG